MRFAYAHKVTSYLMVMTAYLAVVLSGELSPILCLGLGLIMMASWIWEPPRIDFAKYDRMWVLFAVSSFSYNVFDFLTGGEVLIAGVHFLLSLVVVKLFNRRATKDYLHLYILAFLMVVSGTVLNSELSYGLFFIGFVVSSTWAMILYHLRGDMEENFTGAEQSRIDRILSSRRIIGRRFFIGTGLLSLAVFVSSSFLFLAIPRIGIGFFRQQSRSGITISGFSDGVQLGGHGVIKDDPTVVMRVKVDAAYQGRAAPALHWRGVAFDRYQEGKWMRSADAPVTQRHLSYEDGMSRHYLLYDKADNMARPRKTVQGTVRQEIYLEPTGSDVLFAASLPHAFEFVEAQWAWKEKARRSKNDEIRYPHEAGLKYVVYSKPEEADPVALRKADDWLPKNYEVYLQVPPELPPRIRELAADITKDAATQYDKVIAIENWLKKNLTYTLEMESPGKQEPIDHFLFERKKGHCEYFASAMAMLLRTIDIPTRNVNGFLGGEWNEYDQYIAVRSGDAHSWVEVFFPGQGWVTFDPTPASESNSDRGKLGLLDRLRRYGDTLRFKWFKWVIEYDFYRQIQLVKGIAKSMRGDREQSRSRGVAIKAFFKRYKYHLLGGIVLVCALIAVLPYLRRRRKGPDGARRRLFHARGQMATLYRRVLERYEKRGFSRPAATTPLEFSRHLTKVRAPGAASMTELTSLYYSVEYGTTPPADVLSRAQALKKQIEDAARMASQ
jgi:transglutaminase-like putative cysteine protease